ncbi:hypothetical protein GCM10027074_17510 [Streptomyces deserti]
MVKAVAAGVPSLAPFFDENSGLGRDAVVRSRPARGGLQQGDSPGLYGGTRQPTVCDVDRLERYLTAPGNHRKAQAWAKAREIRTDEIPVHLDRLTPVLLRHDTLVKNHDHKKGKAVPFHALLQAGIAILVDEQGLPAVKCSCGNPLRPFEGDTSRISVRFGGGNDKWRGYDRSAVVAVRPAPRELERLALVDVEDPDRGIARPVGTTGEADSAFDTRQRRAVPDVRGTTFGEASRRLADEGLAVAYDGEGLPPVGARVTASDPVAGAELRFGAYVTLSADAGGRTSGDTSSGRSGGTSGGRSGGTSGGTTTAPPGPESSRPVEDPATSSPPPSSPGDPGAGGSSGPTSSAPGESGPTSEAPSSAPPGSGEPPGSAPAPSSAEPRTSTPPAGSGPPPGVTGSPPEVTRSPPEVTSSPPQVTSSPPTADPPATAPPTPRPPTTDLVPSSAPPPVTSVPATGPSATA